MFKKKSLAMLVSLILVLCVTVGGTLAFLIDITEPVENTFTPSKVTTTVEEDIDNGVKTNVKITNTGDTAAYIRAAVVVTWQDANGNVYGMAPKACTATNCDHTACGKDYAIAYDLANGWKLAKDGFYYWKYPVSGSKVENNQTVYSSTGVLITSCKPISGAAPQNYALAVEIIGSGIQSVPTSVVTTEWSSGVSSVDGTTLVIETAG